ncbi:MAG: small basic protein [Planctomycetota bacterium]|jgi:small basic protein (TIGR04137 family)
MSIHNSLKISGAGVGVRNVWTRMERLMALKKVGRWEEGDPVTGLPKVRTRFKVKTKKQLKAEAHAGEAVPGAEGAAAGEGEAAAETEEKKG